MITKNIRIGSGAQVAPGSLLNYGIAAIVAILLASAPVAQAFTSGSTGADGALDFTGAEPGTVIEFDPTTFIPPLDEDNDGIYHFTTVTIPTDVTIRFRANRAGLAPIHWLATGPVVINGTLDLNGENGHDSSEAGLRVPSIPGPGGFWGGVGRRDESNTQSTNGFGPGAGCRNPIQHRDSQGGSAGYATGGSGSESQTGCNPDNLIYGNIFLLPLIGGSGGAGGNGANTNSGGGAGGGAIMIASSVSISVDGSILANGGNPGGHFDYYAQAGGGSGGAIRLVAPTVSGGGVLSAVGGNAYLGRGGQGRLRIEATQQKFTGLITGNYRVASLQAAPILLPTESTRGIHVVSVNGVTAPSLPRGRIDHVDVTINTPFTVPVVLEGRGIPLGTTVAVTVFHETEAAFVVQSPPLSGTLDSSTATINATFLPGFSHIFTHAKWGP
jgi:hypothetical protein